MNRFVNYFLTLMVLLCVLQAQASQIDYGSFSIKQLTAQASSIHPAGLYILASKLFKSNKKDDAVFWLTVGHLRFRFHLATQPGPRSSDGPTLFSSLQNFIGNPINQYAGINPEIWVNTAKKAKQWDLDNDNKFTTKSKYKKEYAEIHREMDDMIHYINKNKDKIRQDRKQTASLKNKK